MSAPGEVLFCRGQDEEEVSEIWDDTALIKAYDEAVKSVKAQLGDDVGGPESGQDSTPGTHHKQKKGRRKQQKKNKDKPKQQAKPPSRGVSGWNVGDLCQAVYTDDGQVYQAVIKDIDEQDGTCTVRFLGYGNEEQQELADLLPSSVATHSRPASRNHSTSIKDMSETESDMDWNRLSPSPHHSARPTRGKGSRSSGRGRPTGAPQWPGSGGWPGMPPWGMPGGMPPPPQPPPFMSMMQTPSFPGMESSSWHPTSTQSKPVIPDIPPPPPPDLDDSADLASDKEAMYSMLISWYMSGYHTGYYQGLKEGKKAAGSVVSSPHEESSCHEVKR